MTKNRKKENGITFSMFVVIIMSVIVILILTMIKIYLSNQIYHESKIVNNMQQEVNILKSESIVLTQKVESLKYKNKVDDTIFEFDDE